MSQASRWLLQAEYDLATARDLLRIGRSSTACFNAQQSAEKALKAHRFAKEGTSSWGHVLGGTSGQLRAILAYDPQFASVEQDARVLDQYYIGPRYPDALPEGAIPFQSYVPEQAQDAIDRATRIVELVRRLFDQASG